MARQTPTQKRANAAFSKQNEKNMGRPVSAIKKKNTEGGKSPLSTPMLVLLIFVLAGTMGLGFAEIGGGVYSAVRDLLANIGILSR